MSRSPRLAELWSYAQPNSDYWYLHPSAGYKPRHRLAVALLRPAGYVWFRLRLAAILLTTPITTSGGLAPWENRSLRWKALALLPLPFGLFAKHHERGFRTDTDPVIVFDHSGDAYSWSYWVLECPVGWKIAGLEIHADGDSISV